MGTQKKAKVDVVIPVYHPDKKLFRLLNMLSEQSVVPETVYLMNTETGEENNCEVLRKKIRTFFAGKKAMARRELLHIELVPVKKSEFDHGGTRHKAAMLSKAPFLLFMTQDAVPADENLIEALLCSLEQGAGVAYARQMTTPEAGILETYTRLFNYPSTSAVHTEEDIKRIGIKAFFCSNVCAMYRKELYEELGGFVQKTIFNEDMIFANKLLKTGNSVAYCAEAKVYHSHSYTWGQQFKRNFDLGVSQAEHPGVFRKVKSEAEGIRMVKQTIGYLWNQKYYLEIIDFIGESMFKYAGYLLGKNYRMLPKELVLSCTMNQSYFHR